MENNTNGDKKETTIKLKFNHLIAIELISSGTNGEKDRLLFFYVSASIYAISIAQFCVTFYKR
jgi:hypothetical protein